MGKVIRIGVGLYGRSEPKKVGLWIEWNGILIGPMTPLQANEAMECRPCWDVPPPEGTEIFFHTM